jgi:manganese-dependent ADP-ribose/CDP-alcohol diphosphatase
MKFLFTFLTGISFLFNAAPGFSQSARPLVRFGLIADIQYGDLNTRGTRFYRGSIAKLDSSVKDLNRQQVQFTINLGDIVDKAPRDLDTVLQSLKRLDKPVHHAVGNHDYSGVTDNEALYKKLGMPDEYYSFKKKKWRFVFLNTNEVSSYANVSGTWKEKELTDMFAVIKANKGKNATDYNGGISSKQVQWLEQVLKKAEKKGEKVLIFSHHPFSCAEGLTVLNDKAVLAMIAQYKSVKALIAGHHHAGGFCYEAGLPCIIAEGMVETGDKNAYGVVELYTDKLVLTGYGRMTSRVIEFNNK